MTVIIEALFLTTATSDSITHAAVVLRACVVVALVFVGLKVCPAVVQLGFDRADCKQYHQNPEEHLSPTDFTQVAIIRGEHDGELIDIASRVHGNSLEIKSVR